MSHLLESLGLHRNTLDRYLQGASVLPNSVGLVLDALDIPIEKALQRESISSQYSSLDTLIRSIHKEFPDVSIFLFGSRSRGKARKYSDFDLGIYSKTGINLSDYLKILDIKEDFEEDSPYRIDCINLHKADKDFLQRILPDLRLLAGFEKDLIELKSSNKGV